MIHSLPAKLEESLGGLFHISPLFMHSSDESRPSSGGDRDQSLPSIGWHDFRDDREDKEDRLTERKLARDNVTWLEGFLGLDEAEEDKTNSLSKATGLKIRLNKQDKDE